jgi:tellurite methyltransferase
MLEDKERWNKKYLTCPMPGHVAKIVEKYLPLARVGRALDIACGTGRNTHFLAEKGFEVDAVDYSDYALSKVKDLRNIQKIEADLDSYRIEPERYDLIVNTNYLDRSHFPQIIAGLKEGGVLMFETFIIAHGEAYHQPSNPDFVLRINELLDAFRSLHVIYYEEREDVNLSGEKVKIATLVARKGERQNS